MLENQIDRLIEFKINVKEIELHYHATKNIYRYGEYGFVLSSLLEKLEHTPDNFSSVLNNWLKRNREMLNNMAKTKSANGSKPVRQEIVPEWLKNEQAAAKVEGVHEVTEAKDKEFQERTAKLQARLKSKYKKTSNG